MNALFLKIKDLKDSKYRREGNRNLLETEFGIGDTVALCGRLENIKYTQYGPRLWINDGSSMGVTVGTFNKNVRKDAEEILKEFKIGQEKYILLYGSPYETDQLYINVNHDNGVIVVSKENYERFHRMGVESRNYLREKFGLPVEDETTKETLTAISNSDIMDIIKGKDKGKGVGMEEILGLFEDRKFIEDKLFELMESGALYEPKPGIFKVIA
ncbi:MAG: hypothetical protein L6243_02690 [Candidatus Altiarchaeales archaeon]|nr:hypothetical protein [Candidatus Altiarchaeota archaeon]MBU4341593.1 hypothetical protein [Candidatus Altiarchaeota archaeon]MBU4406983.1 hypothetical protein [Candidatus Altiarchaeota archaeon]MBU4437399.1 hypothetical protein [Candidatus Altiarchaeota archaeon]MCG2782474.1 hypothetical protein [Candidatus Altiarchaeales archaeon]